MEEIKNKKSFYKTFLGSLLIIVLLSVALYWIFFGSLAFITKHGEEKNVPELVGMTTEDALKLIEKEGFDIQIDSTFDRNAVGNVVLDQQPSAGSIVKVGRIIFLTVNKAEAPMASMPNLLNMSYRNALLTLKKNHLELGDTFMVYDISEYTVLEQRIGGQPIKSGQKIPEGTKIDLIISQGLSSERTSIPDLISSNLYDAIKMLDEKDLRYTVTYDGKITDTMTAKVFFQYPESRNEYGEPLRMSKGDHIEFRIGQNPEIVKKTYIQRPIMDNEEAINNDWNDNTDLTPAPNNTNNPRPSREVTPNNTNNNTNNNRNNNPIIGPVNIETSSNNNNATNSSNSNNANNGGKARILPSNSDKVDASKPTRPSR